MDPRKLDGAAGRSFGDVDFALMTKFHKFTKEPPGLRKQMWLKPKVVQDTTQKLIFICQKYTKYIKKNLKSRLNQPRTFDNL